MKGEPECFTTRLKKQVTIRLDEETITYFKNLAEETGKRDIIFRKDVGEDTWVRTYVYRGSWGYRVPCKLVSNILQYDPLNYFL